MKNIIRPFQYALLAGGVPAGTGARTEVRTVSVTIPFNSKFVWTHTINATIDVLADSGSIKVMLYDSKKGPVCNVPTLVENMAGATFSQASAAPRAIRPFPLPEAYVFESGAVLTATYTIQLPSGDPAPEYIGVGLILCGFRVISEKDA